MGMFYLVLFRLLSYLALMFAYNDHVEEEVTLESSKNSLDLEISISLCNE